MVTIKATLVDVLARRIVTIQHDTLMLNDFRIQRTRELRTVARLTGLEPEVDQHIARLERERIRRPATLTAPEEEAANALDP